jgi:hypothetical protein
VSQETAETHEGNLSQSLGLTKLNPKPPKYEIRIYPLNRGVQHNVVYYGSYFRTIDSVNMSLKEIKDVFSF